MFNDTSSPIALLHSRRSGKPRDMIAPGPDEAQLETIMKAAIRVPDHGKIAPWRFIIIGADQRAHFAARLTEAYLAEKPDARRLELESMEQFANQSPTLIVALSAPVPNSKVPRWEQELSVGAACMNLLSAAHALGFVGSWLTGWPAYSDRVRDAFGSADTRVAGYLFLGSPGRPLEERPRPDYDTVVTHWKPSP
jgi:nitroreductase